MPRGLSSIPSGRRSYDFLGGTGRAGYGASVGMSGSTSKANHVNAPADERHLGALRADFPGWRIWRTRDGDVPVCWVATLRDPAVGIEATVITETAEQLREQLVDQARQAARDELTGCDMAAEILYSWDE